jgi:hypothetical protein
MNFCGIDVGMSGGFAILNHKGEVLQLLPMPKHESEVWSIIKSITSVPVKVCVEQVGGYIAPTSDGGGGHPGSRMFDFGRNVGVVVGCIIASGLTKGVDWWEVRPQEWQATVEAGSRIKGRSKQEFKRWLKTLAKALYPDVEGLTLKTCDALLLAHHCLETKKTHVGVKAVSK